MANNATNTNVDWPAHASGLRNGNSNHLGDTDVSYLLRGDASGHHSRSQYGTINEYHPVPNQVGHNLHPGLHTTGLNTEEQFWPQQNSTSNNTPPQSEHVQNGAPHDENARQDISNDAPSDQDAPLLLDLPGGKGQRLPGPSDASTTSQSLILLTLVCSVPSLPTSPKTQCLHSGEPPR